MTQVSKPVGRPTFRIDGARLRSLRKDAKLTQLALSRQVYVLANKAHVSDACMKTAAQRWEKEGTVQCSMAQHLATVLKTTIAVLQGALPEPAPLRIDEIEQQIKQQITGRVAKDCKPASAPAGRSLPCELEGEPNHQRAATLGRGIVGRPIRCAVSRPRGFTHHLNLSRF